MKVSIQGYKGSFHHQVASALGLDGELIYRENFDLVFNDVKSGQADLALVAMENSIAGSILENFDRLRKSGLEIKGEYYLRIIMNLIAYPGQSISGIKEVRSHAMAIKQCEEFLQAHPQIRTVEHIDTAKAVEEIMQNKLMGVAGIAGEKAAFAFNAEILQAGIETDPQNFTRFLIIGPHQTQASLTYPTKDAIKTSIYFQTAHKPGALVEVLSLLQQAGANMTNLVSRPVVGQAWHYGFYVDFETNNTLQDSLIKAIEQHTDKLVVLGSYPAFARD
jgi:prephenate dehydratase